MLARPLFLVRPPLRTSEQHVGEWLADHPNRDLIVVGIVAGFVVLCVVLYRLYRNMTD